MHQWLWKFTDYYFIFLEWLVILLSFFHPVVLSIEQSFSFSGFASGWFLAEEHRSDEGHADTREDPRNPGHHAGAVQRDDEGDVGLTLHPAKCRTQQVAKARVWLGRNGWTIVARH